jgi:outer membrane protein
MVKGLFASTILLTTLVLSGVTRAQAQTVPAVTPNVVTVSFNAAVLQTSEAQRGMGALETKFAPRQAQLKSLNDEIEAIRKQLQSTADKLSDTERASREQSLSAKQKQLQREAEDFKNDSDSESQQLYQGVAQKVYAFLQTYAQQHGYAVVVERGSDSAPVVWYAAANLDITGDLIKAYNAQSGSQSGLPSGSASPASAGKPATPKPNSAAPQKPQPSSPPQ